MSKTTRLYPKGFVFSDTQLILNTTHYSHLKILETFHYYYDEQVDLNVYVEDTQETFIILHGHYSYVGDEKIHQKLLPGLLYKFKNDYNGFLDTLDLVGGRYVIIIGGKDWVRFYQDASGMRSVYYSLSKNIASSHVHHIHEIYPHSIDEHAQGIFSKEYVWDNTPYSDIKSMTPNLYLDFFKKEKHRFFPRTENRYTNWNESDKFKYIEKLWKTQLNDYISKHPNMVFSITGGSDSRVLMAMAREHLSKIRSFTYSITEGELKKDTHYGRSLKKDQLIVKQILQDIPLNHRFFYFEDGSKFISTEENKVLDKNTIKAHGRWLIPFYNEAFPENDVMHLRGNLLEIGRAYFIKKHDKNTIDDLKGIFYGQTKKHFESIEETKLAMKHYFNEGVNNLRYQEPLYDYHILDLFYWEVRMGRWFAEVLNETDSSFDTFLPFNLRAIIELTLSFDLDKRQSGYVFTELINRNYAVLNFYGKNNISNLYEQINHKDDKESPIFITNSFTIYDNNRNIIGKLENEFDKIYLPADYILKDNYAETKFNYSKHKGLANICLINNFSNTRGTNYLKYQLLVNEKIILEEDIALWRYKNHICLINLMKNDTISLRVYAERTATAQSWSNASKIQILSYEETPTTSEGTLMVTCTSPYSKITNPL